MNTPTTTERPILFSAPMIQAILAGEKTQTRRVIKFPATVDDSQRVEAFTNCRGDVDARFTAFGSAQPRYSPCPYGRPGDRLWVRESYWLVDCNIIRDWPFLLYDDEIDGYSNSPFEEEVNTSTWIADQPEEWWMSRRWRGNRSFGHKPGIHMPRWASRITLEISEVRVQRIQEISEEDARAEGVNQIRYLDNPFKTGALNARFSGEVSTYSVAFRELWDSINGKRGFGWASNPHVWCLTFRRIADAAAGEG